MIPSIVDQLRALVERHGHQFCGETVSQHDHAVQCAALIARDGADDALITAALLHGIGHQHVTAKRLLYTSDPTLYAQLSDTFATD